MYSLAARSLLLDCSTHGSRNRRVVYGTSEGAPHNRVEARVERRPVRSVRSTIQANHIWESRPESLRTTPVRKAMGRSAVLGPWWGWARPARAEHSGGPEGCASGHGPAMDRRRLSDGGPDQSDESKFRDFDDKSVRDMWTYHAVAAVLSRPRRRHIP